MPFSYGCQCFETPFFPITFEQIFIFYSSYNFMVKLMRMQSSHKATACTYGQLPTLSLSCTRVNLPYNGRTYLDATLSPRPRVHIRIHSWYVLFCRPNACGCEPIICSVKQSTFMVLISSLNSGSSSFPSFPLSS